MACHELAALRLGLMQLLGRDDPAERQHELAELGDAAEAPGPLRALCGAQSLAQLQRSFEDAVTRLEESVGRVSPDDPKLPYLRTLIVLTKKVELDLASQARSLTTFFQDLDEVHDFVHEIYPAR